MIKIELTKEEYTSLVEAIDELDPFNDLPIGTMVETKEVIIEIVCSECHGTGTIEVGEHDNIHTKKCPCRQKEDDEE